jgi:hypothetical protein
MGLLAGLALMGLAVSALHHTSASASDVMALSQARGLESDAYFYSEVDDLQAFLEEDGRYGPTRRGGVRRD